MVKELESRQTKGLVKKKTAVKSPVAKSTAQHRKVQAVRRVVQKVPKKKVSILVLVVLAMASVVTVAWLLDIEM